MSSLTQAELVSKKAFFFLLVGIAIIIAALVFLGIGKSIKNVLFPPAAVPSLVSFGKLPSIDISDGYRAPAGSTFQLQTITGGLTQTASMAKVFRFNVPTISFADMGNLQNRATAIGFTSAPV